MLSLIHRGHGFCPPAQDRAAPRRMARRGVTSLLRLIAPEFFAPPLCFPRARRPGRARPTNRNRHLNQTLAEISQLLRSAGLLPTECPRDNTAPGKSAARSTGFYPLIPPIDLTAAQTANLTP